MHPKCIVVDTFSHPVPGLYVSSSNLVLSTYSPYFSLVILSASVSGWNCGRCCHCLHHHCCRHSAGVYPQRSVAQNTITTPGAHLQLHTHTHTCMHARTHARTHTNIQCTHGGQDFILCRVITGDPYKFCYFLLPPLTIQPSVVNLILLVVTQYSSELTPTLTSMRT